MRNKVAALFADVRKTFADVPVMSGDECRSCMGDGTTLLVDVRGANERLVSRIPGAVSREAYEADRAAYEGKTVVCYCTMGYRAGLYAKKLRAHDVDARLLDGALLGWVHDGGQLEDDRGPTTRLHVFNHKFDLVPDGYEGVL